MHFANLLLRSFTVYWSCILHTSIADWNQHISFCISAIESLCLSTSVAVSFAPLCLSSKSASLCVSLSVSLSLWTCFSIYLRLSLSLYSSHSLFLSTFLCASLCLSLFVSLFVFLYVHFLPLDVSAYLFLYLCSLHCSLSRLPCLLRHLQSITFMRC